MKAKQQALAEQTTLSIFVAGAKDLKHQRLSLKALANDLSADYLSKGRNVVINVYSYENFGDNQQEYDNFISHADIVIFILEDDIGEGTRDEFLLASQEQINNGTPKVYVFLKEFDVKTPQIEYIEQLVNENTDDYYIDYANLEDLIAKARKRIQDYVDNQLQEPVGTTTANKTIYRPWAYLASFVTIALLAFGIWKHIVSERTPQLIFAGGRSAANFITYNYPAIKDVARYKHAIYLDMPSHSAWSFMAEDVMNHHALPGEGTLFYPVCLSADEADTSDFLKLTSAKQFSASGSIISMRLGEESLCIYIKDGAQYFDKPLGDSIMVEELIELLEWCNTHDGKVFSTQQGSGTYSKYQDCFALYGFDFSKQSFGSRLDWFYDKTNASKINGDGRHPYVILGSSFYRVNKLEGTRPIIVVDDQHQPISKTIMMYFAGYTCDDGKAYYIPDVMVHLLEDIHPEYKGWIKNNRLPRRMETPLVDIEDIIPQSGNKTTGQE